MRKWKDELASVHLLPHVHTPLILCILSTHRMLLSATGPLHMLFHLPKMPHLPSPPSLSLLCLLTPTPFSDLDTNTPARSLCVPSLLRNCTFMCMTVSAALTSEVILFIWTHVNYFLTISLGTVMSHPQIFPNAPHNTEWPTESPHSTGRMKNDCQIPLFSFT